MFDLKTEVNGQIRDISSGGCRVFAHWPEGNNKIQNVAIYLKVIMHNDDAIIVKAEIKNQQREDPETVSLGLMFVQDSQLNMLLEQLFIN